ncbi:MAG: hypothetical protein IJL76_02975 [Bacilli bacterium]|nr:hypothetical protein [Bacilli bacterium]
MKVESIEKTNEEFREEQKNKLSYFLKLCKYDVIPSMLTGSAASALLVDVYQPGGMTDAILFGGVTGAAFILAVNGAITGIKATKEEKDEIKKSIESKGKVK